MSALHFGRIERLMIQGGEPTLNEPPVITREVKCGGNNDPHPTDGDFRLKAQVIELLQELDRLDSGIIPLIEVKHGLPFRMLVPDRI